MKQKKWKYMAVVLLIAGLILISYSTLSQISTFSTTFSDEIHDFELVDYHTKNIKSASVTPAETLDVDQKQDQVGTNPTGVAIGSMIVCQGVTNEYPPMYAFSVLIEEYYDGGETMSSPLVIGIISSQLTGDQLFNVNNWDASFILQPGELPSTNAPYWMTFTFQNPMNYESGTMFYIILASNDHEPGGNYFIWKYSGNLGNVYSGGKGWTYSTTTQLTWELSAGWNDIYFTQMEIDACASDHPEDVFESIDYDCILNYVFEDVTWKNFCFCDPGITRGGTLQEIKPGVKYLVQVSQDCTLYITQPNDEGSWNGMQNDMCFVTFTDFPNEDIGEEAGTWNLNAGWNDVVFKQTHLNAVGSSHPEDVFESIDYDCILNYVFEDVTWKNFCFCDPGITRGGTLQEIKPGITYQVQVSQACTLEITTGGGGEPPEPELPTITISIYTEIIQASGILSLIGACLSGIKYWIWA